MLPLFIGGAIKWMIGKVVIMGPCFGHRNGNILLSMLTQKGHKKKFMGIMKMAKRPQTEAERPPQRPQK